MRRRKEDVVVDGRRRRRATTSVRALKHCNKKKTQKRTSRPIPASSWALPSLFRRQHRTPRASEAESSTSPWLQQRERTSGGRCLRGRASAAATTAPSKLRKRYFLCFVFFLSIFPFQVPAFVPRIQLFEPLTLQETDERMDS